MHKGLYLLTSVYAAILIYLYLSLDESVSSVGACISAFEHPQFLASVSEYNRCLLWAKTNLIPSDSNITVVKVMMMATSFLSESVCHSSEHFLPLLWVGAPGTERGHGTVAWSANTWCSRPCLVCGWPSQVPLRELFNPLDLCIISHSENNTYPEGAKLGTVYKVCPHGRVRVSVWQIWGRFPF